jgi:3'-phosphoadenosine 5'-phosphosulfate sulfotransferase (PAPS reductase)/FAD synthetase
MKFIVAYSGGKDSLATLLLVLKHWDENPVVTFCDTGWEHEKTYQHNKYVQERLRIKFEVLRSKKWKNFEYLSIKKKRVASTKARFCTEKLKVEPMIDFVLSQTESVLIFQGIRAQESISRSKMDSQCSYFKYYFEPRKYKCGCKGNIHKKNLNECPNKKPVYDTYRKKDVFAWVKKYSADVNRPIFNWNANQVFKFIKENGLQPNPLYYEGFSRVGCFPCIMCKHSEVKLIAKKYPERIQKIRDIEKATGTTFFGKDYVSTKSIAFIDDVVKHISPDPNQENLFEDTASSCESVYQICE